MFGKRPDGRLIRTLEPFQRVMPYIMKERSDSMNMFEDVILCKHMDAYIQKKAEEGIPLDYTQIILAAMVRMLALRPQLNRFIMRGRVFARPKIWISFVVHRSLKETDAGTTVKLCFDGTENIFDVVKTINEAVEKELAVESNQVGNGTDKLLETIMQKIPGGLISFVINVLMWMDRHDMLPKSIIDVVPMHTSIFFTNLKSLGINHIYHHTYNFGTTSLFLALGKEKMQPVVVGDHLEAAKGIGFGLVMDERICDGLYFARALKMLKKYLRHPELLEERLEAKVEDIP